ncbi:MAG: methionyl-tRNA formyltransferase [Patescibacteria group bacterium]
MILNSKKFTFFGSSEFSVYVLEELLLHDIKPDLIITMPDKPKGRKLVLTANIVKIWAQNHDIEVLDPASLKNNPELVSKLQTLSSKLFLVASYGKIIPKEIFDIPDRKTLNIHPSLLPKYRGASPIQSQILNDEKEIGVSIMQVEETMDTGPIIIQKLLPSPAFRRGTGGEVLGRKELEKILAIEGARLFAHILPEWLSGSIDAIMQNEKEVTYCTKINKEDGLLDLNENAKSNLLKIKAFEGWPTTYFFENAKRIIVTDATIEENELKILRVIPEGKKEMSYLDFLRGRKS